MRRDLLERVFRTCADLKEGETLVIVTDGKRESIASLFRDVAVGMGVETSLIAQYSRSQKEEALGGYVEEALGAADLGLLVTNPWLARIAAQQLRLKRRRVRLLHVATTTREGLEYLVDVDYADLEQRAQRVCEGIQAGSTLRFTTAYGTELQVQVAGPPLVDIGLATKPGSYATLPAGELLFEPVPGTATGCLVVDGSMSGLGPIERPIRIKIEKGVAVDVEPADLRHLLDPSRRDSLLITQLGLGLNPRARVTGSGIEDRRAPGALHVTLAASVGPRSGRASVAPLLAITNAPQVFLGDRELSRDLAAPPAPKEAAGEAAPEPVDLRAFAAGAGDTHRLHFDTAHDAQYLVDLATQTFLLVNPAFEALTGFSRDELLFGTVKAPDLIAPESQETYARKRENRKELAAERYVIRLRTKAGEKKPVEASVQRVLVNGRTLVVGSLRDITEQERREKLQKEKLYELAMNGSRIMALAEKIKNVPPLAHDLLHAMDERDILEKAGERMTDRRKLAFLEVNIYLVKDDALVLSYTSARRPSRRYDMKKDNKFVRIVRGELEPVYDETEVVLPLTTGRDLTTGRERPLGLLQVNVDQKERALIAGNEPALKGYQDVIRTLADMLGIIIDNARLYETVRMQSVTDQLTKVFNRRYFDRKLMDELKRALRYGRDLSLVLIDVDHFKEINDTYGHKQGDIVLSEVADLFRKQSREVDVVCRYGGDEFVLLLPETSLEQAVIKAENLRKGLGAHAFTSVVEKLSHLRLSLSVGVSAVSPEVKNEDELMRSSDEALYEAKRSGRDRVCVWNAKGIRCVTPTPGTDGKS
ncbi:MAG: diguanylate cyclase [Planctomycetes bacterium]|nr:diguanylate cyclase [Planctomycetota bacterium]